VNTAYKTRYSAEVKLHVTTKLKKTYFCGTAQSSLIMRQSEQSGPVCHSLSSLPVLQPVLKRSLSNLTKREWIAPCPI